MANERLREAIHVSGHSTESFAHAIGVDPKTVQRWIIEERTPYPKHRHRVEQELGVDQRVLWPIVPQLDRLAPDLELYERLTRVQENPRRVDAQTIHWIEDTLAGYRLVDDEVGSGPILTIVRAHLVTTATLARGSKHTQRDRLVRLVAEWAQFMGWLCSDAGDEAAALAWFDRALTWAVEAGDPNMAATAINMQAHLAWGEGDGVRAVRMAQGARWYDKQTSAGVRGMATQLEARGHAILGDGDEARRCLDEAEDLIVVQAATHADDEPPWLYFYDETYFALQRGMAEMQLGSGHQAVEALTSGLQGLAPFYRRERAWYESCLARAHILDGDLEAAATVAEHAAPDSVALNRHAVDLLAELADEVSDADQSRGRRITEALRDTDGTDTQSR